MSDSFFRAIVGDIISTSRDDFIATPYRRTAGLSPAPYLTGSPSEPREGESPIMENPDNPSQPS